MFVSSSRLYWKMRCTVRLLAGKRRRQRRQLFAVVTARAATRGSSNWLVPWFSTSMSVIVPSRRIDELQTVRCRPAPAAAASCAGSICDHLRQVFGAAEVRVVGVGAARRRRRRSPGRRTASASCCWSRPCAVPFVTSAPCVGVRPRSCGVVLRRLGLRGRLRRRPAPSSPARSSRASPAPAARRSSASPISGTASWICLRGDRVAPLIRSGARRRARSS